MLTDYETIDIFPDQINNSEVAEIDLKPYLKKGWNTVISVQVSDANGLISTLESFGSIIDNYYYYRRPCDGSPPYTDCVTSIHQIEILAKEGGQP